MLEQELKLKINKLWGRFWAGGISNPLTAIEQISYLIFMKRLEDLDNVRKRRAEARGEKYDSVFEGNLKVNNVEIDKEKCRWSHWKHFNADEMITHVRDQVFPFLKNIDADSDGEFSKQLQSAVFMIPKPSLLQEAVSLIDDLNVTARNQDEQGDIYEYLLGELNQAGKSGQFRTPRHIIRMMIEIINPQIGEKICDPACGTSGFLVNAYQHILKVNTSEDLIRYDDEGVAHNFVGDKIVEKKHWTLLKENTLYGYDFDATMARIASMNMILHGIEHPNITRFDTLSKMYEQKPAYDVILANPPFTGNVDKEDINDALKIQTTKTELLFLELIYNILQIGGRCAVIVPYGVLFGGGVANKKIRKLLVENCQIEGVIGLPSGVFKPYSGVSTGIIIFTKGQRTNNVWFYDMKSDGFTLDDKREFIDGKGDMPKIIELWNKKGSDENVTHVTYEEIKSKDYKLTSTAYKKIKITEEEFDLPIKILKDIQKRHSNMQNIIDEMRVDYNEK